MFRTAPLPIIRGLFTVHSAMVYILQVCRQLSSDRIKPVPSWSCSKAAYKPVWYIPLLSVQWINSWWCTEELSETCSFTPKWIYEITASSWFYYKAKHDISATPNSVDVLNVAPAKQLTHSLLWPSPQSAEYSPLHATAVSYCLLHNAWICLDTSTLYPLTASDV